MFSAESFQTYSLRALPEGNSITRILAAAIQSVEPGAALQSQLSRNGDILCVSGRFYNLEAYRRVVMLGIGKASIAMSVRLAGILGSCLQAGLVISKHIPANPDFPFDILEGGHPIPDTRSLEAGKKILEFLSALGPDDLLICLISGGGSALVTTPQGGLTLEDLQVFTSTLLTGGAHIDDINIMRRHLERLKGGGLARLSNGATIISLILSDVVGNSLEAIASGPTAPDPTTKSDSMAVPEKYGFRSGIPDSIFAALDQAPETLKPGDPIFEKVQNVIVGGNLLAAQAALVQAGLEGFNPYLLRNDLRGEARRVAIELTAFLHHAQQTGDPVPRPGCIIVGGETTVTIKGDGRGGRNTELALAAVKELADLPRVILVTLATDGEDGPTDAAGAVVTGETFRRAVGLGLYPQNFLDRNDSYSFFQAMGDLIKTGPTGTNVNDLVFLLVL